MIDTAAIFGYDFGTREHAYVERDAILYALGVGLGADPCDRADLRFLDERALDVLPTYAVTLCSPGMWIREPALGVDFGKLVHFAQSAEFFAPLPPKATVLGEAKVISLTDRGEGRGAVLVLERTIRDGASDTLYCRLHQTLLLRGDGGFGGEPAARDEKFDPQSPPDATGTFAVSSRAALIYRLSGDWNPLHLDPDFAAKAGFTQPILQGLCSYAIAGVAVSRAMGRDPADVAKLACKFSGIVLPGDTLTFEIWNDAATGGSRFRALIGDRKVLDGGEISWK
ncbi:MaoC/PaaZ C-terminal domain-containing protein [Novosphingobium colocasiae]|uniref:Enoyl-CoA hydratase n=1 Tax=Novosphingobium colocasiae TaxID=1256513 RepID=A0A918P8H6_9SPHN|nr:MaoC/PaaZ C-terminal domain-containing protein [Novosphingobium colocasiae]GGY89986.1 enoyl-CoA hydratase [Novosphingobium colocasiae]